MNSVFDEKTEKIFSDPEWQIFCHQLRLTGRQAQIIGLILEGRCDKQIALVLDIAVSTVRSHLKCLFHKLKVQTRQDLMLRAFRQHLVNLRQNKYPQS